MNPQQAQPVLKSNVKGSEIELCERNARPLILADSHVDMLKLYLTAMQNPQCSTQVLHIFIIASTQL